MLTVPPVLCFEPAQPWHHRPPLFTVLLPHARCEGHGWEHVSQVVALKAHLNLGACLMKTNIQSVTLTCILRTIIKLMTIPHG